MKNQAISPPRSTFQFAAARRRASKLYLASCLLFGLCMFSTAFAQSQSTEGGPALAPPVVVATVTSRGARFVAPSSVIEMRLEVFSSTGEKVFDSAFRRGSVLDWDASGAQQPGMYTPDDSYLCVVTARTLAGHLRQRHGLVSSQSGKVTVKRIERHELSAVQLQAWELSRTAQALSPLAEDADSGSLSVLPVQASPSITVATHDEQDGRITSTAGALTFNTGDLFAGKDQEHVRITEEGKVGIGTQKPEATLDVAGTIRAQRFLVAKPKPKDSANTMTSGDIAQTSAAVDPGQALASGSGTQDRIAKWIDNAGTLGDSGITEIGGFIGIGTTTPDSRLVVSSNSATLPAATGIARFADADGVQTAVFADAFGTNPVFNVRRANGTAATPTALQANQLVGVIGASGYGASAYMGTRARVAFWASENWTNTANGTYLTFNTTANGAATPGGAERLRIDNAGNVGIGTNNPTQKLDVAGNIKTSGSLTSATANVVNQFIVDTNTLVVDAANNRVGIGTLTPTVPLDVVGDINSSTQYNLGGNRVLSNAGTGNLFAGVGAGAVNTGFSNSFFGSNAGNANTTGASNSFFGTNAGKSNTTSFDNSFFGYNAGAANTATDNSFFGKDAGAANTSGSDNSFFGNEAGVANITGTGNSFFGNEAGEANTAHGNSFFGRSAGKANTTGTANSFFGNFAGDVNTTGSDNSYFGNGAGGASGAYNSFFGSSAGGVNTASLNTFMGNDAGRFNTSGASNSFFGESAGDLNTSGSSNSFFGYNSGLSNTIEGSNTFLGATSNGAAGITNATAVGANASVTQSDSLVLGNGVKVGAGTSAPKEKLHVLGGNILIDGVATNNNGLILKSPDGLTCAKLTIDNAGALVTTVITCP